VAHFAKNLAILGGLLAILAAGGGEFSLCKPQNRYVPKK
jgi:uncharacterized membrane protein YphA (DoxX/SURF4 family)